MGQANSTNLPYIYSYCKQYNCENEAKLKDINLINLLNDEPFHFWFIYKLKHAGYSVKLKSNFNFNFNLLPLNKIIQTVINVLSLKKIIKSKCYVVNEFNIKSLLSSGNVLLGGVVIDSELSKILNCNFNERVITTDTLLIIGYTENTLIVKTNKEEIINLPNEFINNIKEIWDIFIESPEETYLN